MPAHELAYYVLVAVLLSVTKLTLRLWLGDRMKISGFDGKRADRHPSSVKSIC